MLAGCARSKRHRRVGWKRYSGVSDGPRYISAKWASIRLTAFRCLTLFGAALYLTCSEREQPRPPLDAPDAVIEAMPAEADRARNAITHDREVADFAAAMATAFPRHPILGCDVLREAVTGRLHAVEVNAGGNVWHFSSPRTARSRTFERTHRLKSEFSSFETAARVLALKTRQEAR